MTVDLPDTALELRSMVTSNGTLELSLHDVSVPIPAANEVLVRVEASPINPSDLGVLIAGADMTTATVAGTPSRPIVTASLGAGALGGLSARVDKSLPVGNEGAGTVVAAGSSSAVRDLLGKRVGIAGGGMYSQYRVLDASACLVLPEGATARDGASSFVNPLTALGMLETMRREGHSGLVHTAAASNLGQMLVKLCQTDGVPLVNIVRKPDQEELLRSLGAIHVCNTASTSFSRDLVEALKATSATLGFDATGGGTLASQILNGMEETANSTAGEYRAMGPPSISRCTSTADSTLARQCSQGTSEWRGVLADGCSPHSFRALAPKPLVGSEPGWLRSSPRRSRVPTRGRFHSPACSGPMRSTATSSERPGEVPRYSASATVTATRANDYWFSLCLRIFQSRSALMIVSRNHSTPGSGSARR